MLKVNGQETSGELPQALMVRHAGLGEMGEAW